MHDDNLRGNRLLDPGSDHHDKPDRNNRLNKPNRLWNRLNPDCNFRSDLRAKMAPDHDDQSACRGQPGMPHSDQSDRTE